MKRALCLLAAAVLAGPVDARIYKWVMPDGSIQYSDRPQEEGAKPVELPEIQTYTPPPTPAPTREPEEPTEPEGYESFEVTTPAPDATIRDNGGTVAIGLAAKPGLRSGHTVEILMDGKVLGSGRSLGLTLTNVDRGTHRVEAVIKDEDGNVLARTPPVTFHLKRAFRRPAS